MNMILHIVQQVRTRHRQFVWLISIMMLINFSGTMRAQTTGSGTMEDSYEPYELTGSGTREDPYVIDLNREGSPYKGGVVHLDDFVNNSGMCDKLILKESGQGPDNRVYYKLTGKPWQTFYIWNTMATPDKTTSSDTADNITLLINGEVKLGGMHLAGDVRLEPANGSGDKLIIEGLSYNTKYKAALTFIQGYHLQIAEGLAVEARNAGAENIGPSPLLDTQGTFTVNGSFVAGAWSASIWPAGAYKKISIEQGSTSDGMIRLGVYSQVSSDGLTLKKVGDSGFSLSLPAGKLKGDDPTIKGYYTVFLPAGEYELWDGDRRLENCTGLSPLAPLEVTADQEPYNILTFPYELGTCNEAVPIFVGKVGPSPDLRYIWIKQAGSGMNIVQTFFNRLKQNPGTKVGQPVKMNFEESKTLYLNSSLDIEASGDDPVLSIGYGGIQSYLANIRFVEEANLDTPLDNASITVTHTDKSKLALTCLLLSTVNASLTVNGQVMLAEDKTLSLDGSLEITTAAGIPNFHTDSKGKIIPTLADATIKLSDYGTADPTVTLSYDNNTVNKVGFSGIELAQGVPVKVQTGIKINAQPNVSGSTVYLLMTSADSKTTEEARFASGSCTLTAEGGTAVVATKEIGNFATSEATGPVTLTYDASNQWRYSYTSADGGNTTRLFNGTLTGTCTYPIEIKVEGSEEPTLTFDALTLQPTSGEYALKVSQGKMTINPTSSASRLIPPASKPALLVADDATCAVGSTNPLLCYGATEVGTGSNLTGLMQLKWKNAVDAEVTITKEGESTAAATFPAIPGLTPSALAWNPSANGDYLVQKGEEQQVGKDSNSKTVLTYAYAGTPTTFTELRDMADVDRIAQEASVGAEGKDVQIEGTSPTVYTVLTPLGLGWVSGVTSQAITGGDAAAPSADGFSGCIVKIGNDLLFTEDEYAWIPIGTADHPFKGKLSGEGKSIDKLPGALLGTADGATISNLGVKPTATINTEDTNWGGIAGEARNGTTISNCYVSLASGQTPAEGVTLSSSTLTAIGGIVGTLTGNMSSVKDCYSTLSLTTSSNNTSLKMGGIAGVVADNATLSNCYCTGSLTATSGTVGGIAGEGLADKCLALSPSITGSAAYRVTSTTPTGKSNYATSECLVNNASVVSTDPASVHGETVYLSNWSSLIESAWGTTAWTFNDTDLPKLKPTGGTGITGQPTLSISDYFGYKEVEISSTVGYSDADHKECDLVIKSSGVLNITSGSGNVHSVIFESGAQLTGTGSLSVEGTVTVSRTIKNQWTTFCSPFALKAANLGFALYRNTGYATAAGQAWTQADAAANSEISFTANSPYLLAAETAKEEGETVLFTANASTISGGDSPENGNELNTGIFLFKSNTALHNVELTNIYVLSADGSCFELKSTYTLKPFECYIVANEQTQRQVRSLSLKDMPTGIEQPVNGAVRLWAAGGQLCLSLERAAEVTIVNVSGQVVYRKHVAAGEERVALPSGIYFVRCEDITYKVKL